MEVPKHCAENRGQDDFSVDAEGQLPGKTQPEAVSTGGIYSFEGLQLEVRPAKRRNLSSLNGFAKRVHNG